MRHNRLPFLSGNYNVPRYDPFCYLFHVSGGIKAGQIYEWQRKVFTMLKRRILGMVIVVCLLSAVCSAGQGNRDVSQTDKPVEELSEEGEDSSYYVEFDELS